MMGMGWRRTLAVAIFSLRVAPLLAGEAEALALDAAIQARHMPFGAILDPIYASSTSAEIVGYTRCGDSALWTGAYLAAEAFRHKVTQSPEALSRVKAALDGLKGLVDVTGDNRIARCMVPAVWPLAAGIGREEATNDPRSNPPWLWIDNTSRDQVVGALFGLGAAFDLVDDAGVRSIISDVVTRMAGFISRHQWSPNDSIANTFRLRPEELQMIVQLARHVNPSSSITGPFFLPPVGTAVAVDVIGVGSYFKFNLDYMTFFNLVRIQDNGANRNAYQTVRDYTASHQNAFFNMIDRALRGPNAARDAETRRLLDAWLERPRLDFYVDLSKTVPVCGSEACDPIPVPLRPPTDFIWQRNPFQLAGGGSGFIESAGIDYILPYWMARYYGVIVASAQLQSAAAPISAVAPNSLASLYGTGLAATEASASNQPLPTTLGGATVTVTDSRGVQRRASLLFASPGQINLLIPDGTATGAASVVAATADGIQAIAATVQPVAPALFTLSGTGSGLAAATAIRVQAANPQVQFPVAVFACLATGCLPVPIDVGIDSPVYVTLYGTGIRNRSSLAKVTATVNGMSVPVLYAGATPEFAGLDQVNIALPVSLRGGGSSTVALSVDGQQSNAVTIAIK
jgi:uncharacterized protein (TIGR03437 family)